MVENKIASLLMALRSLITDPRHSNLKNDFAFSLAMSLLLRSPPRPSRLPKTQFKISHDLMTPKKRPGRTRSTKARLETKGLCCSVKCIKQHKKSY